MTYICSPNLFNKYDKNNKYIGKMTEIELINMINKNFNLKGIITKIRTIQTI